LSIAPNNKITAPGSKGLEMRVVDPVPKIDRVPKDRLIAELAARQYGVVSRSQLLSMGIGAGAIDTRLRRHRLHRLHRGVYAVGHLALVPLAREMAAVLACGDGAVVSHRSAAAVWHLLAATENSPIDVTVVRSSGRRRPGLDVHHSRLLSRADVRHLRGLPITAPARTLIDLAETATDRELERATHEALARRLLTARSLLAETSRFGGRRGLTRLKRLIDEGGAETLTRSEAEERFLALVRAAGLPDPEVNARIEGYEVDFLWRAHTLVIEIDGFQFHSSREAFERDRRRDADLQGNGLSVLRFTWRQVVEEPFATLARTVRAIEKR